MRRVKSLFHHRTLCICLNKMVQTSGRPSTTTITGQLATPSDDPPQPTNNEIIPSRSCNL
jgi:hypothetical protein